MTEQERKDALDDQKEVQYYMALVTSWVNSKMEHDKTLVTLSAAAIGLLITILTTKGVESFWVLGLFAISFICYCITIRTSLHILQLNSDLIHKVINDINDKDKLEKKLATYDALSLSSFVIGTAMFASIGLVSAFMHVYNNSKLNHAPDCKTTISAQYSSLKFRHNQYSTQLSRKKPPITKKRSFVCK